MHRSLRQFIFSTPLNLTFLKIGPNLKIFCMPEPQRGDRPALDPRAIQSQRETRAHASSRVRPAASQAADQHDSSEDEADSTLNRFPKRARR